MRYELNEAEVAEAVGDWVGRKCSPPVGPYRVWIHIETLEYSDGSKRRRVTATVLPENEEDA